MKVISLVFLAVCVVLATADIESRFPDGSMIDPRIINGERAERGQFPYQVSLRTKVFRKHFCSASIISRRFLLTSAYCVNGGIYASPSLIVAVVGALNVHNDGNTYNVEKIFKNDAYRKLELGFVHNIALILTSEQIAFTESVQPIALPTQNTNGVAAAVISGWGQIKYVEDEGMIGAIFPQTKWPTSLRYAETKIISNEDCNIGLAPHRHVDDKMICTGHEEPLGICYGDYGSPLVDTSHPEKPVQVGVASQTIGCFMSEPDIFTRVYAYLDWIQLHLADYE